MSPLKDRLYFCFDVKNEEFLFLNEDDEKYIELSSNRLKPRNKSELVQYAWSRLTNGEMNVFSPRGKLNETIIELIENRFGELLI